jgi:Pentapeptide repeats (8 copies)
MTKELELRWMTEPLFIELRKLLLNSEAVPPLSDGMTEREWYQRVAPHTICYATEQMDIDCRHLNFDGMSFGDSWLNYVLDYSSAINTTFERTGLQGASLKHCNMRGSRFIVAQMSPIYAYQANFSDCIFETCFLMGTGRRNYVDHTGVAVPGTYSDFRECDFTNVRAKKSAFERCEMQGANFSQAQFVDCSFKVSDLTGVLLEGTSFERCDFDRAWLDNTPPVRALVERGDNQNLDTIVWVDTIKR